jgi:serine/threonine protein phosphatase 1
MRRVLAIGDIHGCVATFRELLYQIQLSKDDKLVLLGDYVDRGADSKAVLDMVIELSHNGYDVVPIRGNHEQMMIDTHRYPEKQWIWMQNGGWETVASFNCNNVKEIPHLYIDFILNMPLYHEYENYLFVHAGFNEYAENPFEDEEAMLWSRIEQYHTERFTSMTVVHGHTPRPLQEIQGRLRGRRDGVVNLDTGCVFKGRPGLGFLSAYDFTNEQLYAIENKF